MKLGNEDYLCVELNLVQALLPSAVGIYEQNSIPSFRLNALAGFGVDLNTRALGLVPVQTSWIRWKRSDDGSWFLTGSMVEPAVPAPNSLYSNQALRLVSDKYTYTVA